MKHILLTIILFVSFYSISQEKDTIKIGPKLKFLNTVIDYDTIERYSNGSKVFIFYNIGDEPLVISRVRSGCSCTVANYTKDTIFPGERGEITASYNTRKPGFFNRKLTVYSNSSTGSVSIIHLKGFVLDSKKFYGVERKKKK